MKSVFVVVLAVLTALAATQGMDNLPTCAKPCLEPFMKNGMLGCKPAELKCICSKQEALLDIKGCLVKQGCSQADMIATLKHAYESCLSVSITIQTNMPIMPNTLATPTPTTPTPTTHTGTGTFTTTAVTKSSGAPNSTTNNYPTTTTKSTSTGAAATGYVINGLGVAGAAAAFFFL